MKGSLSDGGVAVVGRQAVPSLTMTVAGQQLLAGHTVEGLRGQLSHDIQLPPHLCIVYDAEN